MSLCSPCGTIHVISKTVMGGSYGGELRDALFGIWSRCLCL